MYLGQSNDPTTALKYRLGPVIISGGEHHEGHRGPLGWQSDPDHPQWTVQFELNGSGSDAFGEATTEGRHRCRRPRTRSRSSSTARSSRRRGSQGRSRAAPARSPAASPSRRPRTSRRMLNAGALPVELTRQSVQTVSPTLGQESLHQGIVAGLVGLIAAVPLPALLLPPARHRGVVRDVDLGDPRPRAGLARRRAVRVRADARGRRGPRDLARRHRGLLHRVLRTAEGRGARRQDGRGRRSSPRSSARTRRSWRPTSSRGSRRWSCTSRPSARCAGSRSPWASRRCSTCSSSGSSSGRRCS